MGDNELEEWSPCIPEKGNEEDACNNCPLKGECPYPSLYSCPTIGEILKLRAQRVNQLRKLAVPKGKAFSMLGKPLVGLKYSFINKRAKIECRIERASCDTDNGKVSVFACIEIACKRSNERAHTNIEIDHACNAIGVIDMRAVRAAIIKQLETLI